MTHSDEIYFFAQDMLNQLKNWFPTERWLPVVLYLLNSVILDKIKCLASKYWSQIAWDANCVCTKIQDKNVCFKKRKYENSALCHRLKVSAELSKTGTSLQSYELTW